MELNAERIDHYLRPASRRASLWWLVLVMAIAAAVWSGIEAYRHYQYLLQQEHAMARLRRVSQKPPVPKPSRADLEAERHWRALRQELIFSWYPMFAALEKTTNPNIALLEFIPDKGAGQLMLRGTAYDVEALTSYLSALSEEAVFSNVYLSHQKKIVQNNVEVISFEVRMKLKH